jgi:hypothetical protein
MRDERQRCMARAKTCAGVAFKPQVVSQQRLTHKKKNPPAHVTVFERLTTLVSPLHKKHVISSKKPPQTRLSHAVHHSGGGITRMVSRQRKSGGSSARGWSGPAGGKSDVAGPRAFTLRQRSPTRRASSLVTQTRETRQRAGGPARQAAKVTSLAQGPLRSVSVRRPAEPPHF